jgi:sugar phosphate isomerase/epimerase
MKFGAMNFPINPVLQEIDTFAKLEFDYIEIAMDAPMAHYSILSENQKAITQRLTENSMGIICHLPTFVTTADLTESLRRASVTEMQRSLSVAADLGTQKVVLHPSMVFGMGAFVIDTVIGYALDFISEMVDAAKRLDITICLENMMPRNKLGVEPDDFAELFSTFPSLMLTLDTGHANLADYTGNRLNDLVERFSDRIGHLHFSDNLGRSDDHLAIGKGTINFKKLIKKIKATGYDDSLTLEVFEDNRQSLVQGRNLIKKMLSK